jgi:hypothetical protein
MTGFASSVAKFASRVRWLSLKPIDDCGRGIPLLTRNRDFRAFADAAGLDLVIR